MSIIGKANWFTINMFLCQHDEAHSFNVNTLTFNKCFITINISKNVKFLDANTCNPEMCFILSRLIFNPIFYRLYNVKDDQPINQMNN